MLSGDFFDISHERVSSPETSERPLWPSADAHLRNDSPSEDVEFLPALQFNQPKFRDKLTAKLEKAVKESAAMSYDARVHEPQNGCHPSANIAPVVQDENASSGSTGSSEYQSVCSDEPQNVNFAMSNWDPMAEDYSNKVFNSCREPAMEELLSTMPSKCGETPQRHGNESVYDTVRTELGDIRLHVSDIPSQLTQEGLRNLFGQAGKVTFCKIFPHRDPNKRTNFGFVGYQSVNEATSAIQKFDGFVFEQEGLKLKVSLAKPRSEFRDLRYSDRESSEESSSSVKKPKGIVEMRNGARNEASDSNIDISTSDHNLVYQRPVGVSNNGPFGMGAGRGRAMSSPSIVHQALGHVNGELSGADNNIKSSTAPARKTRPCKVCSRNTTKTCSVCKVPYCSVGCQKQDWAEHKRSCRKSSQPSGQPLHSVNGHPTAHKESNTTPPNQSSPAKPDSVNSTLPSTTSLPHSLLSSAQDRQQSSTSFQPGQSLVIDEESLTIENVEGFAKMFGFPSTPGMVSSSGHSTSSLTSLDDSGHNMASAVPVVNVPDVTDQYVAGPQRQLAEDVPDVTGPNIASVQRPPQIESIPDITSQSLEGHEASTRVESLPDITCSTLSGQQQSALLENVPAVQADTGAERRALDLPLRFQILGTVVIDERTFWGQVVDEQATLELYRMIEELTQHSLVPLAHDEHFLAIGSLCTVQFQEEYCRARIVKHHQDGNVEILYIDYGNSEKRSLLDLHQLPIEFHSLPAQARAFVLHGVDEILSAATKQLHSEFLKTLIENKILNAELKGFVDEERVEVIVANPGSGDGLSVNAQMTDLFQSRVALEAGGPDQMEAASEPHSATGLIDRFPRLAMSLEAEGATVPGPQPARAVHLETTASGRPQAPDMERIIPVAVKQLVPSTDPLPSPVYDQQPATVTIQESTSTMERQPDNVNDQEPVLGSKQQVEVPPILSSQSAMELNHQFDPSGQLHTVTQSIPGQDTVEIQQCSEAQQYSLSKPKFAAVGDEQNLSPTETASGPVQVTAPHPTVASYKRFHVRNLPFQELPEKCFSAVVTHILRPSLFWAQLVDPALEGTRSRLNSDLNSFYGSSVCENYVPGNGMLCVAQFSEDGSWYRATVDCVQNDGSMRVTFFDFGNSVDVTVDKIRKIEERFAVLPRQALKCSLHGVKSPSGATEWSEEATDWLTKKVLNKECKMQVHGRHGEILFVEMFDTLGEKETVCLNSEFAAAGFGVIRFPSKPQSQTLDQPMDRLTNSHSSSTSSGSSGLKRSSPLKGQGNAKYPVGRQGQQISSLGGSQIGSRPGHTEGKEGTRENRTSFEVFVSEVVSPWEFYSQKTDPQIISRLEHLNRDLNQYCTQAPAKNGPLSTGSSCCVKFTADNLWYRGIILEHMGQCCRVRQVDFGNSEILPWSSIRSLPPQFLSLDPVSFRCSLADVRKPRQAKDWSLEAKTYLESLVLYKRVNCRLIHTRPDAQLVELTIMEGSKEVTVASKLIGAGLADEFVPVPRDEKRPLAPTGERSPSRRGLPSTLDSLVLEPAIAATSLPQDREPFQLMVTDISSVQQFCAQLVSPESVKRMKELSQQMNAHYDVTSYSTFQPQELQLYAAPFSGESGWYRCIVQHINQDGSLNLYYVDYGNSDTVQPTDLRPLERQFLQAPFFGLRCSLAGIMPIDNTGYSKEANDFFKSKIECLVPLTAKLISRRRNCLVVDIQTSQKEPVNQMLVNQGLVKRFRKEEQRAGGTTSQDRYLELGQSQAVAQYSPRGDQTMQKLQQELQPSANHVIEKGQAQNVDSVGGAPRQHGTHLAPCSKSTTESSIRQKGTSMEVETVPEGGHADKSGVQATPVSQDNSRIATGNAQATPTKLQNSSPDGKTVPDLAHTDPLPPVVDNKPLAVPHSEPQPQMHTPNELNPVDDSLKPKQSAQEELVAVARRTHPDEKSDKNLPQPARLEQQKHQQEQQQQTGLEASVFTPAISSAQLPCAGETFTAMVTDFTSPNDFCIQLGTRENLEELHHLTVALNTHYPEASYSMVDPQTGHLYAAQFTQDNEWYRGFIIQVLADGNVEVYYVDYGNREILSPSRLRPLVPQFGSYKFQGLQSALGGVVPSDREHWPREACELFGKNVPLFQPLLVKLVSKQLCRLLVDIVSIDESFISQVLANQGLAKIKSEPQRTGPYSEKDPHVVLTQSSSQTSELQQQRKQEQQQESGLEASVFAPAIASAQLPSDGETFFAMVTDFSSPDQFCIQLGTRENLEELHHLTVALNTHYPEAIYSPVEPQTGHLYAAQFTQDNEWYRVFVIQVMADGNVEVYYVDYGNREILPPSRLRPLVPQYTSYKFQGLQSALGGVVPSDGEQWPREACELFGKNVPLFQPLLVKLVSKQLGRLLVDIVSVDESFISQLLVNQGLAKAKPHPQQTGPCSEEDPHVLSTESSSQTSELQHQREQEQQQQESGLEASVFAPAITSAQLPSDGETFTAMVTDFSSPDQFCIQLGTRENLEELHHLTVALNTHYPEATYSPVEPQTGYLFAAQFTQDNEWYRVFVIQVLADGNVEVYYVDYGNREILPPSRLRPLVPQFANYKFYGLQSSLGGVVPSDGEQWPREVCELFGKNVPLFQPLLVKLVSKQLSRLLVDVVSIDESFISQVLVNQGLAMVKPQPQPTGPHSGVGPRIVSTQSRREQQQQQHLPQQEPLLSQVVVPPQSSASPQVPALSHGSVLPLVQIPTSKDFHVLITEIRDPDHLYLQILNQENANSLATLSEDMNRHCTTVDVQPYLPGVGELCCGQFSVDGSWNRAIVNKVTETGKVDVTFVDYGNGETLALFCIRAIPQQFLVLPRQARKCSLSGLVPPLIGPWPAATIDYLKKRILNEACLARMDKELDGVAIIELFQVSSDSCPGPSISQELRKKGLARSDISSLLPARIPQEQEFDGIVTEVQSPFRVWLQKIDHEVLRAFIDLRNELQQYCSTVAPRMEALPSPGQSCCAQFSGDGTWYRARVVDCTGADAVTVHFSDYGNSEVRSLSHLRQISNKFLEMPCLAIECYLAGLTQAAAEKAENFLRHIVDRQMRVKILVPGDERLGVDLIDCSLPADQSPVNIANELVSQGLAFRL